jgi:transcription antitermination factor NusG
MNSFDIECFLPTYKSLRRWKDRRKELELPLFPGYLFVRIALQNRLSVLRIPGVSQLVGARMANLRRFPNTKYRRCAVD